MYNWMQKQIAKHRKKMQSGEPGFTLVEMLVVIAILGILGGAGTVGYKGYVEHARTKADQELVGLANTAFISACLDNSFDAKKVSRAEISIMEGKVFGLSSCEVESVDCVDDMAPAFEFYFAGNESKEFKTVGINSLIWNDAKDCFEIKTDFVATRIVLSSGNVITISAEDMEAILNSTYAEMGYSGVKETIDGVKESGSTLANLCGKLTFQTGGFFGGEKKYTGLLPKLTNAMKAYGLIDANKEKEIIGNLFLTSNASAAQKNQSTEEVANGLSMITAKYLASGGNVDELISVNLGNSSSGVIEPMASGTGGVKTVSAIAVQYALASGFANSEAAEGVMIDGKTVNEYLISADDPVAAIDKVKNLDEYKNSYIGSDQYNKDKNGFVGTMSILGDNIGDINNPGNIDLNGYLTNGLESDDAKEILTGVLGE